MNEPFLRVRDLTVRFHSRRGTVHAVNGVSFDLGRGRSLGIVGESGCGKSQTCFALMGLLPPNAECSGSAQFEGEQLLGAPRRVLDRLRGQRMSLVFQDPMTALTPHRTVGAQLCEIVQVHDGASAAEARRRALEIMERVRIPDPERRFDQYPFEFSGGMRQRIVIAAALIQRPSLVIADEPTTALDVTVQAEVLRTFKAVVQHAGTSLILVTHDLGVVAGTCDEVMVMYAGRVIEHADTATLFATPRHPYTRALLACRPGIDVRASARMSTIEGCPPDLSRGEPRGCAFAPRCAARHDRCDEERPALREIATGHRVACHVAETGA
jgi:oligopeptide/dipeptide ABC transporter ATP-binding protein